MKKKYNLAYKRGGPSNKYFMLPEKTNLFEVWNAVLSYLNSDDRILELGCGPGQLASLIFRNNFNYILGIDYSTEALKLAKAFNYAHKEKFVYGNILNQRKYKFINYNTVIITEVLEHLDKDTTLLEKIKKNAKIIFSVPNFDSKLHVRKFDDIEQIKSRYKLKLMISAYKAIKITELNKIFVCKGVKI